MVDHLVVGLSNLQWYFFIHMIYENFPQVKQTLADQKFGHTELSIYSVNTIYSIMINFNETEKLMLRRLGQEKTGYYLLLILTNTK